VAFASAIEAMATASVVLRLQHRVSHAIHGKTSKR
jgi:hypothetical protein